MQMQNNAVVHTVSQLHCVDRSHGLVSADLLICWSDVVFQDIIQLHISCPSDKEEEKSSKEEYENEEKEKKDKTPRKMLSRGKIGFV